VSVLPLLDQGLAVAGILLLLLWARRRSGINWPVFPQPVHIREEVILICMLAYFGVALLLSGGMKSLAVADEVLHGLVVNNGAQIAGVAACIFLATRTVPGGVRAFLFGAGAGDAPKRSFAWSEVFLLSVVAIGVCPLIRDATAWLILLVAPDYSFDSHPTLKALEEAGLPPSRVALLWIGAAVVAPVAEEVFFRGVLQNYLRGMTGFGSAVALSSLAFAAVHISQVHAVPALFFLGLLLSIAYARAGNLIVPVLIHAAFNLKTLVWESIARTS